MVWETVLCLDALHFTGGQHPYGIVVLVGGYAPEHAFFLRTRFSTMSPLHVHEVDCFYYLKLRA